jgi:hypothetical protein
VRRASSGAILALILAAAFGPAAAQQSGARAAQDWVSGVGGRTERGAAGEVASVVLRGTWVTDGDLARLAGFPGLRRLDLALTRITDHGLLRLRELRGVRELDLSYAELVTDEGMAAVKNWPLERLSVRGTRVTDTTLALLAGIRTLAALDVGFAQITDTGVEQLAVLANLKELALGGNKLTERALQVLPVFRGLTRLDLSGRQRTDSGLWSVSVTDLGIEPVSRLAELRELGLAGAQVSARGLERLTALERLERLDLHGARRVGDDGAAALGALRTLRWVDLKDTGVGRAGVERLRSARPGATVLWE